MTDVDDAIARAEMEAARYSDSAWVDRRILAAEVKRLRAENVRLREAEESMRAHREWDEGDR